MATGFVLRPCRWAVTLDHHHGEKTQKEISLAAWAVCKMDSVFGAVDLKMFRQSLMWWHSSCFFLYEPKWFRSHRWHSCFWGCWQAFCPWWGWGPNGKQAPDPTISLPSWSRSPRQLVPTAPSWPWKWIFLLRLYKTVRICFKAPSINNGIFVFFERLCNINSAFITVA